MEKGWERRPKIETFAFAEKDVKELLEKFVAIRL